MVALLDPEWNLDGEAAAQDLQRSVRAALRARLEELKAPASGLRSRLLRALPTTMALGALQRHERGRRPVGLSSAVGGRLPGVPLPARLRRPAADRRRHPRPRRRDGEPAGGLGREQRDVRRHRLRRPPPPGRADRAVPDGRGHRRLLRLRAVADALRAPGAGGAAGRQDTGGWSAAIQAAVSAVTGDDAAMATLGVGADHDGFRALFAPAHRRAGAAVDRAAGRPGPQLRRAGAEAGGVAHGQASAPGRSCGRRTSRATRSSCDRRPAGDVLRAGDRCRATACWRTSGSSAPG